jgi:2-keto-4-pentenoate hydratase/2-oxohepta-3-ene-1,7-dioic acid hydratase in catechol pathway
MRLVTFEAGGRRAVGAVEDGSVVALQFDGSMVDLIAAGRLPGPGRERYALGEVRLLAPLVPPIILNSGQNYWDHRDEKPPVDAHDPEFFLKAPLAVIGPDEPIILDPAVTSKLDYEVELAVVIGSPAVTSRENARSSTSSGTPSPTTSPRGTARRSLTPRAAGPTGSARQELRHGSPARAVDRHRQRATRPGGPRPPTTVNGRLRQSNSTARMIWGVAELISFFSTFYTLQPGVVIETGTPGGTAWATDPELGGRPYERGDVERGGYLQPGDVVTVEIDGIGSLRNPVVAVG